MNTETEQKSHRKHLPISPLGCKCSRKFLKWYREGQGYELLWHKNVSASQPHITIQWHTESSSAVCGMWFR